MLEKKIEAAVCEFARSAGWLVYKFTSPARAAVPDRLFIRSGRVFFIEFKQEGQKPTAAQEREHLRLRQQGVEVFVIDNVADGKRLFE
jgi:hypothetical protein